MKPRLIVIFGAAVRADGRPSRTLARRIHHAALSVTHDHDATVFCSGAVGRTGPSEASVMARELAGVVAESRLVLDERSRDTLQTVRAATRYARASGFDEISFSTDRYHQPRVRMLFRCFGMKSRALHFAHGHHWTPVLREVAAYPYDLVAGYWAASREG